MKYQEQKRINQALEFRQAWVTLKEINDKLIFEGLEATEARPLDIEPKLLNDTAVKAIEWCNKALNELSESNYQLVDHTYWNSGGNCMILEAKVAFKNGLTEYIMMNEEGCTIAPYGNALSDDEGEQYVEHQEEYCWMYATNDDENRSSNAYWREAVYNLIIMWLMYDCPNALKLEGDNWTKWANASYVD